MFSARLVGRLRRFHGQRASTSRELPRGEPVGQRPAVLHLEDLADALAGDLLDRLAEQAAGGAAGPGAEDAVVEVTRDVRDARRSRPGRLDRGQVVGLAAREVRVGRECLELVEELDRQGTEAVVPLLAEPGRRGVRLPARLDPAPAYRRRRPCPRRRSRPARGSAGRAPAPRSVGSSSGVLARSDEAGPPFLAGAGAGWASFANTSRATPAMVSPAGVSWVRLASAIRPPSPPVRARPAERTGDRTGHRRDRVRVPAVVRAAEHGASYVALGHQHEPERHRELLDRLGPARPASVQRLVAVVSARPGRRARSPCAAAGIACSQSVIPSAAAATASTALRVPSLASASAASTPRQPLPPASSRRRRRPRTRRPPPARNSTGGRRRRRSPRRRRPSGSPALAIPTGAMYIAAPQLTMLPTPASRGSTCP